MQEVYDSQRLSMPQGVELCTDFPEGADKYITTDAVRLKQVLNNLINNAKKFTVQGSITLGYRVDESGYTTVFVEDTGAGISMKTRSISSSVSIRRIALRKGRFRLSICQTIVNVYTEPLR